MSQYPIEQRARVRGTYRMLEDMAARARIAAERGAPLPPEALKAIIGVTRSEDRDTQIRTLNGLADKVKADHLKRLSKIAYEEFNAFCEVINPDEPPESRWHIFLTDALQDSAQTTEYRNVVLNCPPGHAKPVAEDELVLMADGSERPLRDIVAGDLITTHTGEPGRVAEVHEQGELDVVEVTTAAGRRLVCAPDHPVFVNGTFMEAAKLRPGDRARAVLTPPTATGHDISEHAFALAGFVCSRGAHTQFRTKYGDYDNLKINTMDESVADMVDDAMTGLSMKHSRRVCYTTGLWHLRVDIEEVPGAAARYDWTSRHVDKRVPDWVFSANPRQAFAFLYAYLCASGESPERFTPARLMHYVKNPALAGDLQRVYARLGINATVERIASRKSTRVWIGPEGVGRLNAFIIAQGLEWTGKLAPYARRLAAIAPHGPLTYDEDEIVSVRPAGRAVCRCLTIQGGEPSFTASGLAVHNSTYASRLFVAWQMGRDPDLRVIGGGHSQSFVENEFSKKIRNIVGTPEYRSVFPDTVIDHNSRAASQWGIAGRRGQYVARGVGQGVHGFRADFICVDDPYSKVKDAESPTVREQTKTWFISDIGSRILPFGKTFLIMTRFHEDDLTGTVLELNKRLPERDRYFHIDAPAICYDPENDILNRSIGEVLWDYYSLDYFQSKKITEKYHRFALIYQQLATATAEDSIAGKINFYDFAPHASPEAHQESQKNGKINPRTGRAQIDIRDYYKRIVVSVDTASKRTERADYSVAQCWAETHDKRHFMLDQSRDKVAFPKLIEMIEKMARKWGADSILVEDKGAGTAYIQARGGGEGMRRLAPAPVVAITANANEGKTFRFDEITPMIDEGVVYVPADRPWTDAFVRELGQFPDGAHDDQVDAMTQYLRHAKKRVRRGGTHKVSGHG